jgi:hypothetical protein
MLNPSDRALIEAVKSKKGIMTNAEKQRLYRIRKRTIQALEDLTFIADNFPEKQLDAVFNSETILPLMTSMLHREDLTKKRVCNLVYHLIGSVLGNAEFASRIVPNEAKWMISKAKKDEDPSEIVKALFFAASCNEG